MSYVAIARRYRPNSFHEMAGQSHVTRTLKNAILRDRVHHAYLFSGPRGVGKTTSARALARAMNCEQGPTPTPCGQCAPCIDILNGSSPDVKEIDGASNNSVDSIRNLREEVQYLPSSRKRIFIIDEVHMLTNHAFNALLKTLEEPPNHVMFIFATTEPNSLPDTILSRCQRFEFKRIPMSIVVTYLERICTAEDIEVDEGGLRLIARAGEGSMRDSQSLLDQVISFAGKKISTEQVASALGLVDRALLYQMLRGMVTYEASLCLGAINSVYDAGYDLTEFASEMLELLRNATLVVLSKDSFKFVDIPEDERSELEQLSKQSTPDVFTRSFQVMLEVHEQVSRSPRPKLALEMAVARLISIRPAHSIDDLMSKITKMQGGGIPRQKKTPATDKDDDSQAAKKTSKSGFLPSTNTSKPRIKPAHNPTQTTAEAPSKFERNNTHLRSEKSSSPAQTAPSLSHPKRPTIKPGLDVTQKPRKEATEPLKIEDVFLQFVRYIQENGDVIHDVVNNLAIVEITKNQIQFVTPHNFNIGRLNNLRNDDFWLQSLNKSFKVNKFAVRVRRQSEIAETPNERQDRLNNEQKNRLEKHFTDESMYQLLVDYFDAKISSIRLNTPISKGI